MNDRIRFKDIPNPMVERQVLMRWWQTWIVIDGRYILPKAARWLYRNPQIAI